VLYGIRPLSVSPDRISEELAAVGINAEPAVYDDDIADEAREQLLAVDGVLVWFDRIHRGKTRTVLDAMLPRADPGSARTPM
jgi:hypothetical protein